MTLKTTQQKAIKLSAKLFVLLGFLCSTIVQSQNWETVPNLTGVNTGDTHISMFFLNDNIGWIGRNDGVILKTINGGTTWTEQATGVRALDIFFISESKGWAVGNLNSFYTNDGGNTWTTVQVGSTAGSESLLAVYFISETKGWATGYNYVYRTTDGGLTWTGVLPRGGIFNDIYFTSETVGYVVGSLNYILKTTDGGITWTDQSVGNPFTTHRAVHFVDANTAYVCGDDGVIKKSTDAGATWTSLNAETNNNNARLNDIVFTDANTGWVVGNDRTIRSTTDGGVTWTTENTSTSPESASFRKVAFTSATQGLALHYNNLLRYSEALPPSITNFSPMEATAGETVVITGQNFNGTTAVTLGGVPVESFTVDSPTQITVVVGVGLSGDITVTNYGGSDSASGFMYINQEPVLQPIADINFCTPQSSYRVNIVCTDAETASENLMVTANSNNQAIVTDANLQIVNEGGSIVLVVTPETNASGIVNIIVTAEDEANATVQAAFNIAVGGDLESPLVVTQNITVDLNAEGVATITPQDVNFDSMDNCSSSAGASKPIYFSAGASANKVWRYTEGEDNAPQEIFVDWSVVGSEFYGAYNYFGNYGGLEVNDATGNLYVAGGGGLNNFVMQAPLAGTAPMTTLVGEGAEDETYDFEIDYATQTVYTSRASGLYKQTIGSATITPFYTGDTVIGLTLDSVNQVIYFTTSNSIGKINADGTGLDVNFIPGTSALFLTMDVANGRLFWIEQAQNAIYTALADGTETPYILHTSTDVPGLAYGIDFDPASNNVYYSISSIDYYSGFDYILKANADGSGDPEIVVSGDFGGVFGIATGKNYTPRPELTFSLNQTTFTCNDLGENTVTLTATDSAGNSSSLAAVVTVTDVNDYCSTLGATSPFLDTKMQLHPNPTNANLNVNNAANLAITSIQVFDINGRLVLTELVNSSKQTITLHTANLKASVYVVKIETEQGVSVKRFIKQ
ncbi:YCF48-related protein [Bizionia sediminis]|uniref:YCF48-related protein n=1 Tax=Bizionia sediminis TaxID=1737064 RepID=A0ABW5KRH0_9FLAO